MYAPQLTAAAVESQSTPHGVSLPAIPYERYLPARGDCGPQTLQAPASKIGQKIKGDTGVGDVLSVLHP